MADEFWPVDNGFSGPLLCRWVAIKTNARAPLPPPWTVEEYRGISYIVRDANRFAVAKFTSSRRRADALRPIS